MGCVCGPGDVSTCMISDVDILCNPPKVLISFVVLVLRYPLDKAKRSEKTENQPILLRACGPELSVDPSGEIRVRFSLWLPLVPSLVRSQVPFSVPLMVATMLSGLAVGEVL